MKLKKLEDWCGSCKYKYVAAADGGPEFILRAMPDTCIECLRNYIGKRTETGQPPNYKKRAKEKLSPAAALLKTQRAHECDMPK